MIGNYFDFYSFFFWLTDTFKLFGFPKASSFEQEVTFFCFKCLTKNFLQLDSTEIVSYKSFSIYTNHNHIRKERIKPIFPSPCLEMHLSIVFL